MVYDIIEGSNPNTIDWKQFEGDPERIKEYMDYMTSNKLERYIGPDERSKFSLERFFAGVAGGIIVQVFPVTC